MRAFFVRFQFLYNYVLWIIFGIILYILSFLLPHSSSLFFLSVSLYLIILPGYLIWRLLRIEAQGIMRLLTFFGLGLAFYLLINLAAVIAGINIDQLLKIYEIILPLLFIGALFFDFLKPPKETPICKWKDIWRRENIIYLVPIILSIFIFLVIEAKGADFNGDPYYHLAIVRKVIEGSKLNPLSLVFSQTGSANPAYAYPAWHIFVAGVSKILNLDIFTVWSKLTLPLLIFVFLVWWQLSKAIFQKRSFAILAFIFFLTFTFFSNVGYLFQRLTVPDTLAQYFLMPLALVLFLDNIADPKTNYKKLSFFALTLVLLLIVHGIHYFYVLCAIIIFVLTHLALERKNYRKTLLVFFWALVPLLILALALEIKDGFISDTLRHFAGSENIDIVYSKFGNLPPPFKYAFLLTPLLVLFLRKAKSTLMLLALMVLTPLIYWTPLRGISSRVLSFVFTDRLMGNAALYYFVFSALVGVAVLFVEKSAVTLGRRGQKIFLGLLLAIFGMLVISEETSGLVSRFTLNIFYSDVISTFIDKHVWLILTIIVILVGGLLIWQERKKRLIEFEEFTNLWRGLAILAIIAFILIAPLWSTGFMLIKASPRLDKSDYADKIIDINLLGGEEAVSFVRDNIPKKSVVLTDQESIKQLSNLADLYMAYNLSTSAEQDLTKAFDENIADSTKTELITSSKYKIDYVYLRPVYLSSAALAHYFESYPNIYQKIYDGEAKIYKINSHANN